MPNFPPPPTYADPIIVDEITRRSQFNPLWFKWFLDLGDFVTKNGGGGLIQHNNLGALQGGSANEYYHLTTSQHGALTAGFTGTGVLVRQTAPAITNPTITQGRATQLDYTGYSLTPVGVPATVGTLSWDDGNGTLQLTLKNGNITYTIGQQEYAYCYNDSGTALTKGQVVYISGAQGNRIAVKLAQGNSDPNSAHTIGFVAESITAGAEGWVQSSGPIYKLNTLGYTAGATVYLSPTTPGGWTTTRPSAPNHTVILGFIERVSATVGSIYIKVDNGYELDELHNVKITSVANNDLLQYDSTGPFWKNVAQSSLIVGTATNLAGGLAGSLPYQTGAGVTAFLGIGTANYVLTSTGTAPTWTLNTGTGNVVRATSPTIATPTITTSATVPLIIGGTGSSSTLTLRSTSGSGGFSTAIIFQTGINGSVEAMRIKNDGSAIIPTTLAVGMTTPVSGYTNCKLGVSGGIADEDPSSTGYAVLRSENYGATLENFSYSGQSFIRFATDVYGEGSPTQRVIIDHSGNALVVSPGGLGYGTGAGGAVTQGTSRTTGVTLNKPCGAITLVSSAGSATWQSFTVTNSLVSATDTVIVNQKSGTDLYQIFVTNVAAGSFKITFATTGGTTTEQPVFNFAVIKAVTS